MAAAVEPNRAFLRSYLGKALAENKQDAKAANELTSPAGSIPAIPPRPSISRCSTSAATPTTGASANLEKSIHLNDNRAIYRSGFLFDKDRSVRHANLAALYKNVGMTEVSLEEARRAVLSDYLNPSAHLFLSNSINALRDHAAGAAADMRRRGSTNC